MRIFTSWSGERSKAAALGLKSLLQDLFEETVKVFVSDHISPGEAWAQRLGTELEQSEFGILCLTQENFQAPWLLAEFSTRSRVSLGPRSDDRSSHVGRQAELGTRDQQSRPDCRCVYPAGRLSTGSLPVGQRSSR